MVYITTGIFILYCITPARLPANKPTLFKAFAVALGVLATLGAINVWALVAVLQECNCLLNDGKNYVLSKEVVLLGCMAIGGVSLTEVIEKFFEKFK